MMSDQTQTDAESADLRGAIQALLNENLDERELIVRLRALLPPEEETEGPPTTDEATDHPGYQ